MSSVSFVSTGVDSSSQDSSLGADSLAEIKSMQALLESISYIVKIPLEKIALLMEKEASGSEGLASRELVGAISEMKISTKEQFEAFLSAPGKFERLKELSIAEVAFSKDDFATIVKKCPNLEVLETDGCKNIAGAGLEHLARLANLRNLWLYQNDEITGNELGPLKYLPALYRLDLGGCDNLENLEHLKGIKNLSVLFIDECGKIKDDDLKHLEGLELTVLNVMDSTLLTKEGIEAVQAKLPMLELTVTSSGSWSKDYE